MSTPSSWDEARIHAYVDGALDAQASAQLEADSRSDAALAARIARQRELRTRLRAEFASVLEEPIPQRLRDALAGGEPGSVVAPIGAARKHAARTARPAWSLREWGAVAATLVLGVLVGQQVFRGASTLPIETERGGLVAAGLLDTALSTELAGAAPADGVRIGMSFRAAAGEYCRTFTLQAGAGGLACRRDGLWSVELLDGAATQSVAPDGFRQASSALSPAMLEAIAALGAGEPLSAEEEGQRLESGWDGQNN